MNTKRIAALAAAGLAAGAIATAGCASAATPASAASASAAAATATAAKTVKGATHIIAYSINSDGPDFREILTGQVGDYGPGVTVHPDGTVDPEHTSELELNMSHGSFRLSIAALASTSRPALRRELALRQGDVLEYHHGSVTVRSRSWQGPAPAPTGASRARSR